MKNNINASQMKAIMHANGPAMILAGPGSGKTFVIVRRLVRLIENGVDPSKILVITFTKAAAIEMQIRFLKLTDSSYPEVSFGTFHSVFYQIIRNNSSKDSNIQIATNKFRTEIVRDILSLLKASSKISQDEYDDGLEQIDGILSEISRIKNIDLSPSECLENICLSKVFPEIFNDYNRRLREFGQIDFDDMIVRCYELLDKNPQVRQFYQEKYKYILIDEYQDINPMQYKVVRLLLGEEKNLFAVGDDDQSIYGFRGSRPEIMLDFMESFKDQGAKMINLDTNYRCGRKIVSAALRVIEENHVRFKKKLSASKDNGEGGVYARIYESRKRQMEAIAVFLKKHLEELDDMAILFRTNKEAQSLLSVLNEYGIPTNLDSKTLSIYDDKAVKTLLSYISFAINGHKRGDYLKIINVPMRYISRDTAPNEIVNERDVCRYYTDNYKRLSEVKKFFSSINMIKHLRPMLAVKYIRNSVGIDKVFPGSKKALDELERISLEYDDLRRFLEHEKEIKISREVKDKNTKRVNLLTMHGSKGLEFKYVWLPDLNEGIIPSRSAINSVQIEEERRMLYVAMTRAKTALIMSYIKGTKENPMLPSRFLRPVKDLFDHSSESSSGRSTSSSNSTSSK
ncbi:MAG: ATP-dependent helicase [Butyrivibrio sp.]|uniref:ATP-dependent helicase n=1 Tax=Butyrivibrio sp. TaxID=28121 RepID=UPI001B5640BE|nr:ATP-dependent helicase [Butyrivibrio sp.]MBP3783667.1 ATP-dependent helicase [Butyrivibrio sp.]